MIVNLKQKLLAESHDSENFETFDTNIINITIWKKGWIRILSILADFLSAVLTFIWFGLWTGLKITDKNADFLCLRVVFLKGVEHIDLRKLAELKSRRSQDGLACSTIRRVTEMAGPSGWQARDARTAQLRMEQRVSVGSCLDAIFFRLQFNNFWLEQATEVVDGSKWSLLRKKISHRIRFFNFGTKLPVLSFGTFFCHRIGTKPVPKKSPENFMKTGTKDQYCDTSGRNQLP